MARLDEWKLKIRKARLRRNAVIRSANGRTPKEKNRDAYISLKNLSKNVSNPLIKLAALKDAAYFRKRF